LTKQLAQYLDRDGCLNSSKLRRFVEKIGFGGTDEEWKKEHKKLCGRYELEVKRGTPWQEVSKLLTDMSEGGCSRAGVWVVLSISQETEASWRRSCSSNNSERDEEGVAPSKSQRRTRRKQGKIPRKSTLRTWTTSSSSRPRKTSRSMRVLEGVGESPPSGLPVKQGIRTTSKVKAKSPWSPIDPETYWKKTPPWRASSSGLSGELAVDPEPQEGKTEPGFSRDEESQSSVARDGESIPRSKAITDEFGICAEKVSAPRQMFCLGSAMRRK
jgi:hypothetical protein